MARILPALRRAWKTTWKYSESVYGRAGTFAGSILAEGAGEPLGAVILMEGPKLGLLGFYERVKKMLRQVVLAGRRPRCNVTLAALAAAVALLLS